MATENHQELRKEFEEAKREYQFWTQGGKCQPGSQKWEEVSARYTAARDAYLLTRQHINIETQSEQNEPLRFDPLLQIFDRGQFEKDIHRMSGEASANHPLSMLMIELDNFKAVNDTYGHVVGDYVLRKSAAIIKSVCESKGSPYRYGGDEIAALLPNYTIEEATVLAERIRNVIYTSTFEEGPETITVSIGVACYPETTEKASQLVQDADRCMYQAKGAGKNRVSRAETMSVLEREKERSTPIGDVQRRTDAVRLLVSVDQGYASNFLILVANSPDEEVSIKEVCLESDGYRLTNPAQPPSKNLWKIKPHDSLSVGWRAAPDPAAQLLRMYPNEGLFFRAGIEIVLHCEILGKLKEFRQKILVQVDVNNRHLQQLLG